jgi:hypothetical protein
MGVWYSESAVFINRLTQHCLQNSMEYDDKCMTGIKAVKQAYNTHNVWQRNERKIFLVQKAKYITSQI